jgi:uncharacterized protein YjbI with pentapeptide repeats
MLFESQQFDSSSTDGLSRARGVYRYCDFSNITTEGGDVDGVFIGCTLTNCEWYWGLFVCAVFVNVKFINCTFYGTSFSGSKFVDCEFTNCKFLKDNLGGNCEFNDVAWYACSQFESIGLEHEFKNQR